MIRGMKYQPIDAEAIRAELARRHWTTADLARRVGVSPAYVRWVCRGAAPSPDVARRIGEELGFPVEEQSAAANSTTGEQA